MMNPASLAALSTIGERAQPVFLGKGTTLTVPLKGRPRPLALQEFLAVLQRVQFYFLKNRPPSC